jgi:predicted glycosyl hydrolase (DUF1957 family)
MGLQVIQVTKAQMAASADGTVCLTLSSGTGTFEVYFQGDAWARLGESAKWFERENGAQTQITTLAAEREVALERQRESASELKHARLEIEALVNALRAAEEGNTNDTTNGEI